jgi:hypothetical protein
VKEWTKEEVALLSDDELLTIQGNLEEGQRLEVASASSDYLDLIFRESRTYTT